MYDLLGDQPPLGTRTFAGTYITKLCHKIFKSWHISQVTQACLESEQYARTEC